MSDKFDFHHNQGEDYYDFISEDNDNIKKDNAIYMWKEDGKKYKKVYDADLKEFVWELAE